MLKNYFKTAIRSLLKRKGFTVVNILGLTIGIACCQLLFQYVSYEKSYDSYAHGKQLYRTRTDSYENATLQWQAATSYPVTGPNLKKEFPEVLDYCRLKTAPMMFSNDAAQVKFQETKGYFADASVFRMLNVQLVQGDTAHALKGLDKMVMSQNMAQKYFGGGDAVGRILTIRDAERVQHYIVTGVFKNYTPKSHLVLDYLVSYATLGKIRRMQGDTTNQTETQWGWYDFLTYIRLAPGVNYQEFEKKMPAFCTRHYPDLNWAKANKAHDELHIIPVEDIHLNSHYIEEAEVNGSAASVNFLFLVALAIITIAWVNYINLATARSVERAKEAGIRKVLGARRSSLIKQFMAESLVLNLTCLLLAFVAALALTPAFNRLVGHNRAPALFNLSGGYWLLFVCIFVAGTFLSGLYPAFVLSGYQPVKVLKGMFKNAAGGLLLRKGLIVLQFAASIMLISGTIVVYNQVGYMRRHSLGFAVNQTLVVNSATSVSDSLYPSVYGAFKNELLRLPGIKAVTESSNVMGQEIFWSMDLKRLGGNEKTYQAYNLGVDDDFIQSYGIKMAAGRSFSKAFGGDKRAALLNEACAKLLGYKSNGECINTKVVEGFADTLTVIGVVADFHHMGLQKAIMPQIFLPIQFARNNPFIPSTQTYYSLKVSSANMPQTVQAISALWARYFVNDPFNYFFLDDFYNQQYAADALFGRVFGVFALLAILIACFGLSGLSAYNILQRTKEIGIRKVLGAPANRLLYLLSKDFMLLVILAFVLATPVAWWVMYAWLQGFAYRVGINGWIFLIAGLLAAAIALATIVLQALKAVGSNPVSALRSE